MATPRPTAVPLAPTEPNAVAEATPEPEPTAVKATPGAQATPEPEPTAVEAPELAADVLALVLDDDRRKAVLTDILGVTPDEDELALLLWDGTEQVIRDCMSGAGLVYNPRPRSLDPATLGDLDTSGDSFGQVEYNYSLLVLGQSIATLNPNRSMLDAMGEAERTVWGETVVECSTDARVEVLTAMRLDAVAVDAFVDALDALDTDPRLEAAVQLWSACMTELGFPFDSMNDLEGALTSLVFSTFYGGITLTPPNVDLQDIDLAAGDLPELDLSTLELQGLDDTRRQLLTPEGIQALTQARDAEIAIRQAYDVCQPDLERVQDRVRAEIEAQFIIDQS